MKLKQKISLSNVSMACGLALLLSATSASAYAPPDTVFLDTFDAPNGTALNGRTPDIGSGAWSVTSGSPTINNGSVDTSSSTAYTFAFGTFTQALTTDGNLTLDFSTLAPADGHFLGTSGFAGISLFAGNIEEVFLGLPGQGGYWGISGTAIVGGTQSLPGVTSAAESAEYDYAFDTGSWTFTVGGQTVTGQATPGLAFNQVRIGGDHNNIASINVSGVQVTANYAPVPEPTPLALAGLGGLALWFRKRK